MAENAGVGDFSRVSQGGSVREKRIQAAVNLIQTFGPSTRWGVGRVVEFLRADSFSLTSEMALVHYPDLAKQCVTPSARLRPHQGNRPTAYPYAGVGPPDSDSASQPVVGPFPVKSDVDATSLGYQLFLRGEYTNPFDIPITVNPTVGWRHDFHGTTPNQTFIEDRMAVSAGPRGGLPPEVGREDHLRQLLRRRRTCNLVQDRDFVSLSVSYSF